MPEHTLAGYFIAIQQGADYVEPDLVISQGRRAARPPRKRDRRHHRRRVASGVRRAQDHEEHRRRIGHRLVHRRLHARGIEDAARARTAAGAAQDEHALRRRVFHPDLRRGARSRRRRGCAARRQPRAPQACRRRRASASIRKPSTRATSRSSGCTSTIAMLEVARAATDTASGPIPSACSPSRSRISRRCAAARICRWCSSWRPPGQPFDFTLAGDPRTYLDLMSDAGPRGNRRLRGCDRSAQVDGGAVRSRRRRRHGAGAPRARRGPRNPRVDAARRERIPAGRHSRSPGDAAAHGNLRAEIRALLDAGITGFFSDHPDLAVRARDEWWARQ